MKRSRKFWYVWSAAEFNLPCAWSTEWELSSRLVQVASVPGFTVIVPGVNAKLSIFTSGLNRSLLLRPWLVSSLGRSLFPEAGDPEASSDESTIAR